jgi:hypothetical protein
MNRKSYSSLLFGVLALSLILFGIPLKVSAYHSGSQPDLAGNPELITLRNFQGFTFDDLLLVNTSSVPDRSVRPIDSVRRSALGVYYAEKMARLRGAEAHLARWVAKGIFEAKLQSDREAVAGVSFSSEAEAIAYFVAKHQLEREAMAPVSFPSQAAAIAYFVAKHEAEQRAVDAASDRWAAIGDRFIARGLDAASDRWTAMGDYYRNSILVDNPELISVRSYKDLVDNPELLSLQQYETCGC